MFKNKQIIIISILILMLVIPILYLFFQTPVLSISSKEDSAIVSSVKSDITSLESAVKTNPSYENLVNLSMAYINNNMPGKSICYLQRALELDPNSAIVYNNLGVAYTMMQQYQDGINACTKALQIDTSFQLAKNNLKWANDEKSKIITAIGLQEHSNTNKKDVAFFLDYGYNYFKIGNYDKSIEIWNKVFDIEPKNTLALNNIGMAFMMKGQYEDAALLFKQLLQLDPDNALAKNNLTLVTEKIASSTYKK